MRTPILAGIVAAFLMISGCASAPAAPATVPAGSTSATASATAKAEEVEVADQSVLEACDAIGTTMDGAATAMAAAMKTFESNPTKAVAALSSFNTTMDAAVAKLGNPEVKAQSEKAVAAMKGFTKALDDVLKHPANAKEATLTSAMTKVDTEFTAIGTVCGA